MSGGSGSGGPYWNGATTAILAPRSSSSCHRFVRWRQAAACSVLEGLAAPMKVSRLARALLMVASSSSNNSSMRMGSNIGTQPEPTPWRGWREVRRQQKTGMRMPLLARSAHSRASLCVVTYGSTCTKCVVVLVFIFRNPTLFVFVLEFLSSPPRRGLGSLIFLQGARYTHTAVSYFMGRGRGSLIFL